MNFELPQGKTGDKLFKWLVDNQKTIIAQKKLEIKKADACYSYVEFVNERGEVKKASDQVIPSDAKSLKARLIINTTNLFDSHYDVHINDLWKKSLAEAVLLYLLEEHKMSFKHIICDSDNITAFTKAYTWKQLGAPYEGSTQALVFDVIIEKDRNEFMFEQYRKKYVKNHSVGMRYMKVYMCINDEGYSSEFDNWNKYYPVIANKDEVDAVGFFFAVTEAKVVEGSAVPKGSNFVTPTQSIEENKSGAEPPEGTHRKNEPLKDTRILEALTNLSKSLN